MKFSFTSSKHKTKTGERHRTYYIVDFESGSRFVLRLEAAASEDAVRNVFEQYGFNNPNVTRLGARSVS